MAKVQAPLFGFVAGGALGDAIVYSKWKGILYVRRYVVPANPNTEDQQTQRGYFTQGVTFWHSSNFSSVDKTAWDLWASSQARPMSGFNLMISELIRVRLLGDAWVRMKGLSVGGETPTTVEVQVYDESGAADLNVIMRFGTDPHFFGRQRSLPWDAGRQAYWREIDELQSGVKYYAWFEAKKAGVEGTIGLLTFKTT